jgi:DNA-binding transcriptional regulator of glucitol operon
VAAASYRFLRRPLWLLGHLLVLAAVVTMVLLGRWQLDVSNAKHFDLQNFGYALQWWAFSIFAVAFWIKILHDRASAPRRADAEPAEPRTAPEQAVAYRRYVMPNRADAAPDDPARAAYNAYLADLAERDGK